MKFNKPVDKGSHMPRIAEIDRAILAHLRKNGRMSYVELARDIGFFLDSGGHLISLKRIKSGNFSIEMAKSIDEWIDIIKAS